MYHFDKINHLHTFQGRPLCGTSTVLKVVAKPLTWWASGLAVGELGWKNPKDVKSDERIKSAEEILEKIKAMEPKEYLALLDKGYSAHSKSLKKSAEAGTDLHAQLEEYVKWHMAGKKEIKSFDQRLNPFIEWTDKNVKRFLWSEMHCFSEKMWLGGVCDAGAELNNGEIVIIDFKSAKEAYPTHFFQVAAYDMQIQENGGYDDKGNKTFSLTKPVSQYIVVPFGAKHPYPVVMRDTEGYRDGFRGALMIYKQLNKEQK